MEMQALTRDLFLFAATFRERVERGGIPSIPVLGQEVKAIFLAMDRLAREDPAMSARYEKMRYGLVALVDEIIVTSTWSEAPNWPFLELEFYNSNIAGDRVYDLIEELTPADGDLIEGYFFILALGFRGKYSFEEAQWSETLLQLYRRLSTPMEQTEFKLSPEAYRVISQKAQRLNPLFSLGRSLLVFFLGLILLFAFYQFVWISNVNEVRDKVEEVRHNLRDAELKNALEDVSR